MCLKHICLMCFRPGVLIKCENITRHLSLFGNSFGKQPSMMENAKTHAGKQIYALNESYIKTMENISVDPFRGPRGFCRTRGPFKLQHSLI